MTSPEDFVPHFAAAYAARDAAGIADLCDEDAVGLTLTGAWAEGQSELERLWSADFAGALARTRLVTGKGRLVRLPAGPVLVHQRFVLSGVSDAEGRDAGRLGAMLFVVLARTLADTGWSARSLILAPLA